MKIDAVVTGRLVAIRDERSPEYVTLVVGTREFSAPAFVSAKRATVEGHVSEGQDIWARCLIEARSARESNKPYLNVYAFEVGAQQVAEVKSARSA